MRREEYSRVDTLGAIALGAVIAYCLAAIIYSLSPPGGTGVVCVIIRGDGRIYKSIAPLSGVNKLVDSPSRELVRGRCLPMRTQGEPYYLAEVQGAISSWLDVGYELMEMKEEEGDERRYPR